MYTKRHDSAWRRVPLLVILAVAVTMTVSACWDEDNPDVPPPQNIGLSVISNKQLNFFEAAVNRAGLATTLNGAGPFTIFAPTDDAFRAAGFPDTAAINRTPAATLQQILSYHIINGTAINSSAIAAGQTAQQSSLTSNGTLYISKAASTSGTSGSATTGISVNNARVVVADQQSTNGVIHLIDRVLMPPAGNILQVVAADTSLSLLAAAAQLGGTAVTSALSGSTALTVFAPTNAAFRAAGFGSAAALQAAPPATLTSILTYHVVPGVRAYSPTLTNGAAITTFQGGSVTANVGANNAVTLTGRGNNGAASNVVAADISATNGVIHKIDRVLLP
ncbi:fasciclin domain-containing protein [Spirosoma knui]